MQEDDEKERAAADIERQLAELRAPVDVEFEYYLQQAAGALRSLVSPSANPDTITAFVDAVLQAKILFESKILNLYGCDYRGGTGPEVLIKMIRVGLSVFARGGESSSTADRLRLYLAELIKLRVLANASPIVRR